MSVILVVLLVMSVLLSWAWIAICDAPHLQCEWIVFAWLGMLLTLVLAGACWWWSRVLVRDHRSSGNRVVVQAVAILMLGVLPCGTVAGVVTWQVFHDVPKAWDAAPATPVQVETAAPYSVFLSLPAPRTLQVTVPLGSCDVVVDAPDSVDARWSFTQVGWLRVQ